MHRLSTLEQTGHWTDINLRETSSAPVSQRVFTLYECHGVRPENEAYAYILVPGINSAEELARMDRSGIQILSRTRAVHAVEADGMIYAVFFEPGSLTSGSRSVEVDTPCALATTAEGLQSPIPTRLSAKYTSPSGTGTAHSPIPSNRGLGTAHSPEKPFFTHFKN